jgi:hypothetical protein
MARRKVVTPKDMAARPKAAMVLTKAVDTGLEAAAVVAVVTNVSLTMVVILASLLISLIISDGSSGNTGSYASGGDTQGKYGDGGGECG